MEEIWKTLEGSDGMYEISNGGRVRSNFYTFNKVMKINLDKDGYPYVHLAGNFKRNMKIHRLVALTFLDNPENKPMVNHIDGVKTNNHVSNLEWVTQSENEKHAWKNNLKNQSGTRNHRAKLTDELVLEILKLHKEGVKPPFIIKSYPEVSYTAIYGVLNRKTWKHLSLPND